MKWTPQKTMEGACGRAAASRASERVARHVGELDHLVALVVVPEDEHLVAEGRLGRPGALDQVGVRWGGQVAGTSTPRSVCSSVPWPSTRRGSGAGAVVMHRSYAAGPAPSRTPRGGRGRTTLGRMSRIFTTSFASVYPLYVTKVERKGRTKHELDEVIEWLTGFDESELGGRLAAGTTFEDFFAEARLNPHASQIKGVVCGVRVEEIDDPLMQKIRYLDKLVDELAKGKSDKVLRG